MKPPLNASKRHRVFVLVPQNSKKHVKHKLKSSNTEINKSKTYCKYSETKKVKQVHSVIPN